MYKIIRKEELGADTYLFEIVAPHIAQAALPGQFIIVKSDETAERIPLTISDTDLEAGTITLVIKTIGYSTKKMLNFNVGDAFRDVVGPLGRPSEFTQRPIETFFLVSSRSLSMRIALKSSILSLNSLSSLGSSCLSRILSAWYVSFP